MRRVTGDEGDDCGQKMSYLASHSGQNESPARRGREGEGKGKDGGRGVWEPVFKKQKFKSMLPTKNPNTFGEVSSFRDDPYNMAQGSVRLQKESLPLMTQVPSGRNDSAL